jgi:hypothetical protein
MPKTVRVNYHKATKDQVAEELRKSGYRIKLMMKSEDVYDSSEQ